MTKILILGDIHGRFDIADAHYEAIRQQHPDIDLLIQVGDFGFFPRMEQLAPWKRTFDHPCFFVDGNHEDHSILQKPEMPWLVRVPELHRNAWKEKMERVWRYQPRGTVQDGILYIGGARSIDPLNRIRDWDWFPEENISYWDQEKVFNAIEEYGAKNIHTVISHDAPGSFDVSEACVYTGIEMIDGNRKFLDAVLTLVRPERWFFGHYHRKMEGKFDNTTWRCVDMLRKDVDNDYVILEV